MRSRIEELEKKFFRYPNKNIRQKKWRKIMNLDKDDGDLIPMPELDMLRERIQPSRREGFVKMITLLYGDFSDVAAHNVRCGFKYDRNSVKQMLGNLNILPDESHIQSIQDILTPLNTEECK